MQPGKYDLALYRGDTYQWRFRLWRDEQQAEPVDLAGCTVRAEIRDKSAGRFIIELPLVVLLPNVVDMRVEPAMYKTCPARGVWDLQIVFPDATVHTPIYGTVQVTGDVTDSLPMPTPARR